MNLDAMGMYLICGTGHVLLDMILDMVLDMVLFKVLDRVLDGLLYTCYWIRYLSCITL